MIKDELGNRRFYGTYRGIVVDSADPESLGRLRIKVPQVLGEAITGWSWGVNHSDTLTRAPLVGSGVWVVFEGGDPSFPVWTGTFTSTQFSYGAFYDTTTQTISSTSTAYPVLINTVDQAKNVSIVNGSKITMLYPGTFNLQWSGQFQNTDTKDNDVRVWLRYNGTDYPWSNSVVSVPASHGGTPGHVIAAWNWVGTSHSTNDYVQIMWCSDSTTVSLASYSAGTSPVSPAVPSVIVTLTQVK